MPRIKASPKKCVKPNPSQQSNNWLLLMKGDMDGQDLATPDVIQLRHPQTDAAAMFLLSPSNNTVQEVLTFSENKRSWLIDETIKSDGKLQLSTPIDPLFLVLPYLRKSSHAVPLNQLLKDEEFPEIERLLSSEGLKQINQISDRKGDNDVVAYKYNEEKTLGWLQRKVERVAEVLKEKGISVTPSASMTNTFVKATKPPPDTMEARLRYAHGLISEYLSDDLSRRLRAHIGLQSASVQEQSSTHKRKQLLSPNNNTMLSNENKRSKPTLTGAAAHQLPLDDPLKSSNVGGVLDLSKPEKVAAKPTANSKEKARAKAATGSKNISQYFKRK